MGFDHPIRFWAAIWVLVFLGLGIAMVRFGFGSVLGKVQIMFRVLSRYQADGLGFEIPGSVYCNESGLGLVPY